MISTIINNVNCGAGEVMGTGTNHCPIDINRITTLGLVKRGFKFDNAESLNLAYIKEQQQFGNIIILKGVVQTTSQTADDNITTREGSGIEKLSGKNPIKWMNDFDNGLYFSKALQTLISYGGYDLVFWDADGTMFLVTTKSGEYKGFSLYQFNASFYSPSNGADAAIQSTTYQINRFEYDNLISWITSENLDYNAETDLDGYNDLTIEVVTGYSTETDFVIDVFSTPDNKKVAITGLEATDFVMTLDGVADTIVSLTPVVGVAGRYTVVNTTALTLADVITINTYDTTLQTRIIDVEGVLYKSNVATYTVIDAPGG